MKRMENNAHNAFKKNAIAVYFIVCLIAKRNGLSL